MKFVRKIMEMSPAVTPNKNASPLYRSIDVARKTLTHSGANAVSGHLKDQGIEHKEMGSGFFGAVYQHPTKPDQVIKIFKKDSAYHNFAKYAHENHKNDPHLPKIHAIHHLSKNIGYARMEKLHSYGNDNLDHPLRGGNISGDMKHHTTNAGDASDSYSDRSSRALKASHPTVHSAVKRIASHFKDKDYGFDLHKGNMMHRADGTPVISDPVINHGAHSGTTKAIKREQAAKADKHAAAHSENRKAEAAGPRRRWPWQDIKEEMVNTAGGGNIAGIGVENPNKPGQAEPGVGGPMVRRKKFAGHDVFEVTSDTFHKARVSKQHMKHWKTYIGEDDTGKAIREYARTNPNSSIVLQDERTGAMSFARYGRKK